MGNLASSEEQERQKSADGKSAAFPFGGSSSTPGNGTDAFSGAHNSSSQQLITPPGKMMSIIQQSLFCFLLFLSCSSLSSLPSSSLSFFIIHSLLSFIIVYRHHIIQLL